MKLNWLPVVLAILIPAAFVAGAYVGWNQRNPQVQMLEAAVVEASVRPETEPEPIVQKTPVPPKSNQVGIELCRNKHLVDREAESIEDISAIYIQANLASKEAAAEGKYISSDIIAEALLDSYHSDRYEACLKAL